MDTSAEPGLSTIPLESRQSDICIETMAQDFGQDPVSVVCPSCKAQITTEVDHVSSTKTHLIALALCLCLCWPCLVIPYCTKYCRDAKHYCPKCNAFIGTHKLWSKD